MPPDPKETALKAFTEVIETMAFMFVEAPPEGAPAAAGPYLTARMRFTGAFSGSIEIAVPEAFCPVLAANVLGRDPGEDSVIGKSTDAFKELLNVTCGRALLNLFGDEPAFTLQPPETAQLSAADWKALASDKATACVTVEGQPVCLKLRLDPDN